MEPLTLFTWGYWGWGSATKQLVEAVDAVEASRGFKPPMFVDIRLERGGRAAGFVEHAFERTVGSARYRWMPSLGNMGIKTGGPIRIKDPAEAETLLDLAERCARDKQRVLFFCACEWVCNCHRATVAGLVLAAAERRKLPIQIVEWPGGEPEEDGFTVDVPGPDYAKLSRGASTIPLGDPESLADVAAIQWYSELFVVNADDEDAPYFHLLTGPAKYKRNGWCLPILGDAGPDTTPEQVRQGVQEARNERGLNARHSKV